MSLFQIGIKRRFWFGYKKYTVVAYKTEVLGEGARLVLHLPDGVSLAVPDIHRKMVSVYPIPSAVPPQTSEP